MQRATKLKTSLVALFAFLLLFHSQLPACDMSEFVQDDFSKRCKRIAEAIQATHIAVALDTPNKSSKISQLYTEWIDFFLSHSKASIPPSFSFVKPEVWQKKLVKTGYLIKKIAESKANKREIETALCFFEFLTQPDTVKSFHTYIKKSQSLFTQKLQFKQDLWIEAVLIEPFSFAQKALTQYPILYSELGIEIKPIIDDYERIKKYSKDFTPEELEPLISDLKKSCSIISNKWNSLLLAK